MKLADKVVLITGANRGIGRALVDEALGKGASTVYAGTRQPLTHPDARVKPLPLDVTDTAQIDDAVAFVGSLDVLVNNAGIAEYDDLTAQGVSERLPDLTAPQLRKVRDRERRTARRKTVLAAIERELEDR